ncbi:MAG: TolC family outer membrane protein [Alphaproteobacteria bacterium]|nr:TolC family outer membrane protein [Alphaproteobacteria bacterium]MBU1514036.1 TolC family outer membrane protein [Alphaproteobacteria bacterium]MBU2093024.1 TolC family outer membrane protein [Alphaproteobacteria bacterium]MBU2151773.1 TolC family outer membrane protein [Alphaproteobacteria bacterium]MBU2309407.1 TolC family outer membrane protein [Alphaproteobacteria bacterium]
MSMKLRGRLLAATVCAAAMSAVAVPASAETLADAIALAYQNNPTLQAQRATQRALDENYVQARSGWRPTLGFSANAGYSETRIPAAAGGSGIDRNGDGIPDLVRGQIFENNSSRIGLSFTQPIWTGGRVAAAVNAANADVLAGRENLRRVEAQTLASVIQAYSDTRRDVETVRIRQENVNVLTRQLQESNARFDVGEVTRTDVAQSQARLSQAQALLQSAVAQLAITRATYATLVGQNPGDLAPEPSLAFLLPTDPDEAFKLAEQFNPQLRAQEFTEQASRARLAGARAEHMPSVSASATYGFNGPAIPDRPSDVFQRDLYSRGITGQVTASVPLFTGGLTTSRVRQAVERNNVDRITIEGVRRNVLQSVTTFWSQLMAARANISSSDEQVRASRIAAEGTRQEQQVGLRTTIDVLNAENELRQAELNAVTSRRDEYVAAANVLAVMGRLEGKNLVPVVPQYDAAKNFRKLRITWGWVPWEEAVGIIDNAATPWPSKVPVEKADEKAIGPGLEPAPAAAPPATR